MALARRSVILSVIPAVVAVLPRPAGAFRIESPTVEQRDLIESACGGETDYHAAIIEEVMQRLAQEGHDITREDVRAVVLASVTCPVCGCRLYEVKA